MTPVVYINCSRTPFINDIINGKKLYETRTRNTLHTLIGKTVLLAETGKGKATVKASALIDHVVEIRTCFDFEKYRPYLSIDKGSKFDWEQGTKVKYLYHLTNVYPVPNFVPDPGVKHGRTWMEYNGSIRTFDTVSEQVVICNTNMKGE